MSLAKAEEEIFSNTVKENKEKEGTLAWVQARLCKFGIALTQSKLLAAAAWQIGTINYFVIRELAGPT